MRPLALLAGLALGAATGVVVVVIARSVALGLYDVDVERGFGGGCAAQTWGTTETLDSTSGAEVGRVGEGTV